MIMEWQRMNSLGATDLNGSPSISNWFTKDFDNLRVDFNLLTRQVYIPYPCKNITFEMLKEIVESIKENFVSQPEQIKADNGGRGE